MATTARKGNPYNSIQRSITEKRLLKPLNPNIKIQILICFPYTLEVVVSNASNGCHRSHRHRPIIVRCSISSVVFFLRLPKFLTPWTLHLSDPFVITQMIPDWLLCQNYQTFSQPFFAPFKEPNSYLKTFL